MRRINRYSLLERVASGASSDIYLAATEETFPGSLAILKLIKPRVAADAGFSSTLYNEAEAAVGFRHSAAVNILEIGQADGDLFIAMEHVEGRTFAELLQRASEESRPLARELILWICAETAAVLSAAHKTPWSSDSREGMVHGEVSPSSILITYDGRVKVLGLGIGRSRFRLPPSLARLQYRAPELLEADQPSELADIYSLGVVIYDAVTGDRLFKKASIAETKAAIQRAKFDRLKDRADYVSEIVDELVWQMMSRYPDSRPQSAEYVERALRSHVRASDDAIAGRLAEQMRKTFAREIEDAAHLIERLVGRPVSRPSVQLPEPEPVDMADVEPIFEGVDPELDRDTLQGVHRLTLESMSGGSNSEPFGGKTEPMMQMRPPPQREAPVVSSIADAGFEDKTPFSPFRAPVEHVSAGGQVRDPFDDTTPLATPLVRQAALPDLPGFLPGPALPPPAPPVSSPPPFSSPTAPALRAPSNTVPVAPVRSTSSSGLPAPVRAPSGSTPVAPRAPSTSRGEAPGTQPQAPLPRTPSRAKTPPRDAREHEELVRSEANTAPHARVSSSSRPAPAQPAARASQKEELLSATDLLADLLDTIDDGQQPRTTPSPTAAVGTMSGDHSAHPQSSPPAPVKRGKSGIAAGGPQGATDPRAPRERPNVPMIPGSTTGLGRDRMGPTSSGAAGIAGSTGARPALHQLARFEVLTELGRSGAARLYEARPTAVGPSGAESVLLKVLDPTQLDDPRLRPEEWVACFGREVSIARRLSYAGLPRLIEAGQDGNLQYIAYDRVDSVPLNIAIGKGKIGDAEAIRRLVLGIASALSYLHERGFMYCNVQAQSIVITRDGIARLNDLSLAAPNAGPEHPLLSGNIFALSPEYLSGQPYSPFSDQFALGALIYEMLTQTRPFRGLDDRMILNAIREKDPLPPHTIDSRVNVFMSEIAMRALEKQPEKRFPSCEALAQALQPGR